MKKLLLTAACAYALTLPAHTLPALAQSEAAEEPASAPSPNEIVNSAAAKEWVRIAADDLLVMTLAPDAAGNERVVIMQLMPAPFSQGWVENIRTLARAEWYDGISVNRVQDNYVVQWGDPGHDNPEGGEAATKPLPEGLNVMGEEDYPANGIIVVPDPRGRPRINYNLGSVMMRTAMIASGDEFPMPDHLQGDATDFEGLQDFTPDLGDNYGSLASLLMGWPITGEFSQGRETQNQFWPVHCYGMVGVGRSYSPDTGSGAELYTVIGHAPRHLDRNIALVGRIISGMEHLSSMTRGTGALGFYTEDEAHLRTPIQSIRVASDLPASDQPRFEYLSTEGESFAAYAEARANRRDPFFIVPAGGADICNIPVPIRAIDASGEE